MRISQRGVTLIRQFEGFSAVPYKDVGGLNTIGVGHLIQQGEVFHEITEEQAEDLLRDDIRIAERAIDKHVHVKIDQNQYDALCSFIFNLGVGAFAKSTLLRYINDERWADAANEFLRWTYVSNKPSKGLQRRRAAEKALFMSLPWETR